MSSPTSKKTKKERRSKFDDVAEDNTEEKSILHDESLAVSTTNKRRGFDMSRFSSEVGDTDGSDPSKKIKVSMNPWTNRPYSKRYYEILKTR